MSWLSEFPPEIFGHIFSFLSLLELECLMRCGSTVVNRKLSSGYIDRLVAPRSFLYEHIPFSKVDRVHYYKSDCENCLKGPLASFRNIQSIVYRRFRHSSVWFLSLMSAEYPSLVRLDLSVAAHTFEILPEICSRRILLCRTMSSLEQLHIEFGGTHHSKTVELAIQYLLGTLPQTLRSFKLCKESGFAASISSLLVKLPPQLEELGFFLSVSSWRPCPAQAFKSLLEQLCDIQKEVSVGSYLRILPEEVLNGQISLSSILPASLTSLSFVDRSNDVTTKLDDFPPGLNSLELDCEIPMALRLSSLTSLTGDNVDWSTSSLPSLQEYTGGTLPSNLLPQLRVLKHTSALQVETIPSARNLTSLSIERTSLILDGTENQETRAIFELPNLTDLSAYTAILDEKAVSTTIIHFPIKLKALNLEFQHKLTRRVLSLLPPSLGHLRFTEIKMMEWDALEELKGLQNLHTLILATRASFAIALDSPDVFWTQEIFEILPKSLTTLKMDYALEITSSFPITIPLPNLTSLSLSLAVMDIQCYVALPSTLTQLKVYSIQIHEPEHLLLLDQLTQKLPKVEINRQRIEISTRICPGVEPHEISGSFELVQLLSEIPELPPCTQILYHMPWDLFLISERNHRLTGFQLC